MFYEIIDIVVVLALLQKKMNIQDVGWINVGQYFNKNQTKNGREKKGESWIFARIT